MLPLHGEHERSHRLHARQQALVADAGIAGIAYAVEARGVCEVQGQLARDSTDGPSSGLGSPSTSTLSAASTKAMFSTLALHLRDILVTIVSAR